MTPKEAIYLADYCLDNTQVREALKDMARQVEELQEDAERYLYYIESSPNGEMCFMGECYSGKKELDDAIDAARKAK